MTVPPDTATRPAGEGRWWLRPVVVLPSLLVILLLVALLTPEQEDPRAGSARLTTYSTGPQGAALLHELARRLGWRVDRRLSPAVTADPATIHAVLDPAESPMPGEAHALLEHVRAGGALLFVLGDRTTLAESLHVYTAQGGSLLIPPTPDTAGCGAGDGGAAMLWPNRHPTMYGLRIRGGLPRDGIVFARRAPIAAASDDGDEHADTTVKVDPTSAAAVGYPLGRGRVVVVSDPDFLRNDVLRVCRWNLDVVAVRMLEYLRAGGANPRGRVVFDEYHHGYGAHAGSLRAIAMYLSGTRSGRVLAQLLAAAVVLLLAVGARTVPPRPEKTPERRSPLEHVDALAHAYAEAGATRTAAERLVRGVRRRTGRGALVARSASDESFLAAVAARHPALVADADIIRRALDRPLPPRELAGVGDALRRVESTLSLTHP